MSRPSPVPLIKGGICYFFAIGAYVWAIAGGIAWFAGALHGADHPVPLWMFFGLTAVGMALQTIAGRFFSGNAGDEPEPTTPGTASTTD